MNYQQAQSKVSNPKNAANLVALKLKELSGLLSRAKKPEDQVKILQDVILVLGAYTVSLGQDK